jgi:hypothetical protein
MRMFNKLILISIVLLLSFFTFINPAYSACTLANPTVTISPNIKYGNPGDALEYTVNVKNNNVGCPSYTYNLTSKIPDIPEPGWSGNFSSDKIDLNDNETKVVILSVKSPSDLGYGKARLFLVNASLSINPSYYGFKSAFYATRAILVPGLIIVTEKLTPTATYPGYTVNVYGNATYNTDYSNGTAVAGALVTVIILETGSYWTTHTIASGDYNINIIAPNSPRVYTVRVNVTDGTGFGKVEKNLTVNSLTTSTTTSTSTILTTIPCNTTDPPYCSSGSSAGYPCGNDSMIAGKTTYPVNVYGKAEDFDYCLSNTILNESYCEKPWLVSYHTLIDCKQKFGSNFICSGGRCISYDTTSITTTRPTTTTTIRIGGCPILKAWDGKEFKDIEKLNIHSEEGIDTTYSKRFEMEPFKDKTYRLILSEAWYALLEGSHIDSVKLMDENGKECQLISAIHNKNGDVLSAIARSDDIRTETKPGQEIALTFAECSGKTFEFTIEGYNSRPMLMKQALTYTNLIAISIALIILIVIVYGAFKFFARKQ